MRRKMLSLALLFGILVLSLSTAQTIPNSALMTGKNSPGIGMALSGDAHGHFEFNVGAWGYYYFYGDNVQYRGDYGTFTVHYDDITFFIVDQENFDKYIAGQSYSRHCVLLDVVDGDYKFRFPYADTWYTVFCNKDSVYAKDITADLYCDLTPPVITLNLDTGATYSGVKEIRVTATDATFDVYRIRLYINGILKRTVYSVESLIYNWITTDYTNGQYTIKVVDEDTVNNRGEINKVVTVYNAPPPPEMMSTPSDKSINIGEKVTLTWGFKYLGPCTWKIRIGNAEVKSGSGTESSSTQYASYAFTPTSSGQFTAKFSLYYEGKVLEDITSITVTSTTTEETTGEETEPVTTTTLFSPLDDPAVLLGLSILFFILGIGLVYATKRRRKEELTEVPEQVTSRDAKVLVICPFCGAKTEQGIMKCENCGAKI